MKTRITELFGIEHIDPVSIRYRIADPVCLMYTRHVYVCIIIIILLRAVILLFRRS